MTQRRHSGFSLIELMVVVAIIAIMVSLAVPSFGTSSRLARERSVVQRLTQDFVWARGAAGANDASTISSKIAVSGVPVVTMTIRADCSWTMTVNGTTEPDHTMTPSALTTIAPSAACTGTGGMALPATVTFTPQGFVNATGTLTFNGGTSAPILLQVLYSGAMFRSVNAS